jgi:YVTN family beta-propeller protein
VTGQVYVLNGGSNNVSVIDGATNTFITNVPVGTDPVAAAVNPVTGQVYVLNNRSNTVSVINGANNTVAATVSVGSQPYAVAVNPVAGQVYVVNGGNNNVSVIDGANNTVAATVSVGSQPQAVGVNPVTGQVYVANASSNNVSVIDGAGLLRLVCACTGSGFPTRHNSAATTAALRLAPAIRPRDKKPAICVANKRPKSDTEPERATTPRAANITIRLETSMDFGEDPKTIHRKGGRHYATNKQEDVQPPMPAECAHYRTKPGRRCTPSHARPVKAKQNSTRPESI